MKLFMFYVGGDCGNSNIELHDVRFSMGEKIEDCYEDLRRQWWGTPKSLHIDTWTPVEQTDGYDVVLSREPFTGPQKLFFLNLGGYLATELEELHKNVLLVEETPHKAIMKALKTLREWRIPHKDNVFEVEKVISVSEMLQKEGYSLHLVPAKEIKPLVYTSKYIRINVEALEGVTL